MRKVKLLGRAVPLWLIIAVLVVILGVAIAASYVWFTVTVKVEVKEPLKFGVNYVGWEAPPGADMVGGYYSQETPLTCEVSLCVGESTHGNPELPEEIRDLMPLLTISGTDHTFNSFQVANEATAPVTITFSVSGETESVYMVVWGDPSDPDDAIPLNGYTVTVDGNSFIIRGVGVVAEGSAEPGTYEFTVEISRS